MKKVLLCSLVLALLLPFGRATDAQADLPKVQQMSAAQKQKLVNQFWKSSDKAFHDGDYPLAISFHKAIVILDPHDVESYSDAAWLMWSLGNGREAQRHLQRGIRNNPKNWNMWDAAGQQDMLQKYFSKAEYAFLQAVKYIPQKQDSKMLRRRLAHAAEHADDLETAYQTWKRLVKEYPKDVVNKNNFERVKKEYK